MVSLEKEPRETREASAPEKKACVGSGGEFSPPPPRRWATGWTASQIDEWKLQHEEKRLNSALRDVT